MAGLFAGGAMVYTVLAIMTIALAILSFVWVEYRSHKKYQRIQKMINKTH